MRLASARVCSTTWARKAARRAGSQPFSSGHWGATTENRSRPRRGNSFGGPFVFTFSSSVPDSPLPCRKRSNGCSAVPPFASNRRYGYIARSRGSVYTRLRRSVSSGVTRVAVPRTPRRRKSTVSSRRAQDFEGSLEPEPHALGREREPHTLLARAHLDVDVVLVSHGEEFAAASHRDPERDTLVGSVEILELSQAIDLTRRGDARDADIRDGEPGHRERVVHTVDGQDALPPAHPDAGRHLAALEAQRARDRPQRVLRTRRTR